MSGAVLDAIIDFVAARSGAAHQWLFETILQPAMFALGLGNLLEDGYAATLWLMAGMAQIAVIGLVFGALQRWRPVEPVTDRAAVRVDIVYTLIHRLGLFRLVLFFAVDPLWDLAAHEARMAGLSGWQLDQAIAPWWPGVTDTALFAFIAYLVVLDFVDYWIHRGQHGAAWWWGLHSLHHSQRQMTMWSDNRNHLLDDLLRDSLIVLVARLIGIAPDQFVAMIVLTQLLESLSHANVRLGFGPVGERLLVSPRFHRLHHGIGVGHEARGPGTLGGRNFAVLLPVWDLLFRTADFDDRVVATGIRDQLPEQGARDYGRGFWRQQWLGVRRMIGRH